MMFYYLLAILVAFAGEALINIIFLNLPLYWPMVLFHIAVPFFLFNLIVWHFDQLRGRRTIGYHVSMVCLWITLFLLIIIAVFDQDITHADQLNKLGQVKVVNHPLKLDPTPHIPIISLDWAKKISNQTFQEYKDWSQYFSFNHFELQMVKNTLYWVAPMEFKGLSARTDSGHMSRGYIMVNAENPDIKPEVKGGFEMRITFGAFLWNKPQSYLYFHGFSQKQINEPIFEVDDTGKPYYVIPIGQPTVGFSGQKLLGSVILNPENGHYKFYPLGKTPVWVDRVFPEELAEKYADWWGVFIDGWMNAHSTDPTTRTQEIDKDIDNNAKMMLIYDNNRFYWTAGTIPPREDTLDKKTTAVYKGFIAVDCLTGKTIYYPGGNYCREKLAIQAVKDNREINPSGIYQNYPPTLANLDNELIWIVPLCFKKGQPIAKVALVGAQDYQMAYGVDIEQAMAKYSTASKIGLVQSGSSTDIIDEAKQTPAEIAREIEINKAIDAPENEANQTITGNITRINHFIVGDIHQFYVVIDNDGSKIYQIATDAGGDILVAEKGDWVKIIYPQFYKKSDPWIKVESFRITDFHS